MQLPRWVLGRRTVVALVAGLAVALLAGILVVQQRAQGRRLDAAAASAAQAFATAAQDGDLARARMVDRSPATAQEQYAALTKGLGSVAPEVEVTAVRRSGTAGTADLRWTWPFGPKGWTYTARLPLAPVGAGDTPWGVRWSPPVVHPALEAGDVLAASRPAERRAEVLGRDGKALVTNSPVVEIGVQPSRTTDPASLSRTLAGLLDVDAAGLEKRVKGAAPDAFVPVITLRRSDYLPLRSRLQPLAGAVFRTSTLPLARTRAFARALLGTAGPVTAEIVDASGGRLAAGDVAGLSGLQKSYDARLAGTGGARVEQRRGQERTELFAVAPVPGKPVRLTLDAQVQEAADTALARATGGNGNASLVAVDVASGDVLAVANTPLAGADRATTGRYAPGSTLKAVSTFALLGSGLAPEQMVACPPTATVDGRSFRNFERGALGQVPFRTAFAQSCNTAFVGLSRRLGPPALPTAAAALGLGVPWLVGVDVFAGDVPVATTPVELAAQTIGQGRVLSSPAAMAQVAATLARGSWSPPRLVVEPEPGGDPAPPPAADPARVATVRALMRQVVVDGTASALADVPGKPVHAKTGTAEYGTDSPPRTHAWTIGFQGGIAFAVLVEDGASGGSVAVPVAEAFLRGL